MSLTRRELLLSAAACPLLAQKTSAAPPSIVLIVAEELGAWTLGCYGNQDIRTPNIDLLARGGMRFLNCIACTPAGAPSRATLLTGRTPAQHGIQDALSGPAPAGFRGEGMLSDALAGKGYQCGYAGVWQMGDDATPQHGFKFWSTADGYPAESISQKAVEFLTAQKANQPFLLVVSYRNARPPYEGHPQKYYDQYAKNDFPTLSRGSAAANAADGKAMLRDVLANQRKCAAVISELDDQIPMLQSTLARTGLRDNTLVLFAGASGALLGRRGLWGSGAGSDPVNMYEEVVRVPLIWNWPGNIPVQAMRPEVVSLYDVVPSLCEITGTPVPAGRSLGGRSIVLLAQNKPLPKKERWPNLVFGQYRNTQMARDNRFKLVLRNDGAGPNEFYSLGPDPGETKNQYDNPQFVTVRDQLAKDLAAWRRKTS